MTKAAGVQSVREFLIERLASVTKQSVDAIDGRSNLLDIGLQSIDAVLLCGEVEDHFRIELDPATIFEHDTVDSFAADIADRLIAQRA